MRLWFFILLLLLAPLVAADPAPNAFQKAKQVAEQNFSAAQSGNRQGWGSTFGSTHGDLAALWLQAQEAKRGGFTYSFGKSVSVTDTKIQLIFTKRDEKGKAKGGCPITLLNEGGRWVVSEASY